MKYFSIVYVDHEGTVCEFRRFSQKHVAENCAEMLNQAYVGLSGDEEWKRFGVVTSSEFEAWPADCYGILEVDLDATFDR